MKRFLTVLLFMALMLPGGIARGAESPRYGGRLVFGIARDLSSLNPFFRTRSTNKYLRHIAYEGLVNLSRDGRVVPALAESWKISADGLTYTFKLRSGVKFHDGTEMSAEDVEWCVRFAMDPQNVATGINFLTNVREVKAKDKLTVEFTLKQPDALFLAVLADISPFVVVPKGSVPSGKTRISKAPPGTGPFTIKDYQRARQIVFARHKDYWQKGVPYLDEIVAKPVGDAQVRFTSLRAGDLDMIERTPYAFVTKILKGEYAGIKATEAKSAGFRRLIFNVVDAPFNDVRLRQAVRYALDKQKYIDGAFWGLGKPTDQIMPAESPWHVKLAEVKPDPARVKALLKEAGAGQDFEVEILARSEEDKELVVLQQLLTSGGIKTRITAIESAAREARTRSGDFQITLSGVNVPSEPGEEYTSEYGCNPEELKIKRRLQNQAGFCDKEFDRLMQEAGKTTDDKKRYELYARAIRIHHDNVPDIPMAYVPRYFTYNQKVRGFATDLNARFNMVDAGLSRVWIAK